MSKVVVITGANRGIGLEFAKQFRAAGDHVIALCRTRSKALEDIGGIEIYSGIELTDANIVAKLPETINRTAIDLLILNAGILHSDSFGAINFDALEKQFSVNAVAPLRVTESLRDCFTSKAKLALITSRMGSMGDNTSGSTYGYRMSKAALNAAGKSLAHDLKPQGVAVGIFHPGWVKTEMVNYSGLLEASESAALLRQRIEELNTENAGRFIHADGSELPW
ncbi:Short-chain dehydrogenase [Alteromonadaceae bacterium Bs31]|nr:Short-chain dehydrogenase [Alteromonadaceae bacterium Bs31]